MSCNRCNSCGGQDIEAGRCVSCNANCGQVTPYYVEQAMCAQDNRQRVVVSQVTAILRNVNPSAVPACGQTIPLIIAPVDSLPIGAWVAAIGIGQFEIVSYNPMTAEMVIRNTCPATCTPNAPAGTAIPSCTNWILTYPACGPTSGTGNIFPYLAESFTAPPVCIDPPQPSCCISILVTNVNGLQVNKNVSIAGGTYQVQAITDGTHITICNRGAGVTPGTPVVYQDAAGNLIVPIVTIDANVCDADPVLSGALLSCSDGLTSPITGLFQGQVFVLDDPETGDGSFATLGVPTIDCTTLTVCLTLDPDLPIDTPYIVQVVSTADFTEGQILIIGGIRFVVDSIVNATSLYLIPEVEPSAVQTFPVGASLCSANCCEVLAAQVDILEQRFISLNIADAAPLEADPLATPVTPVGSVLTGNVATLTFTNTSTEFAMNIHITFNYRWDYNLIGSPGDVAEVVVFGKYYVGPNPVGALAQVIENKRAFQFFDIPAIPGILRESSGESSSEIYALPVGDSVTIRARADLVWNLGDITRLDVFILASRITYLGVAILP